MHYSKTIISSYIKENIMTHTQLTQLVQALLDAPQSNPKVKIFIDGKIDNVY